MVQKQDRYIVRMPDGMRDRIRAEAAANGRSMNAEIVARLEASSKALRDEFAMATLTGLATNLNLKLSDAASIAYRAADAMLAERKKGGA